ncbi:unnamed protein product, partial [Vitis vinifera]
MRHLFLLFFSHQYISLTTCQYISILNGVSLEDDKRELFNKSEQELEKLSKKFAENVMDATTKFEKLITNKKDIEGLSTTTLGLVPQKAASKGHENAIVENGPRILTLDDSCFLSVMQQEELLILMTFFEVNLMYMLLTQIIVLQALQLIIS